MDEALLEKIRKLLRLAQSDNPHEAALAAGRAQALMERHQIESVDLNVEAIPEVGRHEDVLDFKGGKLYAWRIELADTLARAHRCRIIIQSRFSHWADENKVYTKSMTLVGSRNDAAAVGYLHTYCSTELERLVKIHAQGKGKRYVNSFRRGVVLAIREALEVERRRTRDWANAEGRGSALAKLDQMEVKVVAMLEGLKDHSMDTAADKRAQAQGYLHGQEINVARVDPESRGLPAPSPELEKNNA